MRPRRRILTGLALAVIATALYACASIRMTGGPVSPESTKIEHANADAPVDWSGGDTISVVTWNLGYGGLGEKSDFFADGGRQYLPPSRVAVRESVAFIADWLGRADADIILTQEMARASAVNLWVDLKHAVDHALSTHASAFYPDFQTRLLPPPLRIRNGQATYSRQSLQGVEAWVLPADGDPYGGTLRRRYAALVSRVEGPGGCWTFVNVHTSAFDENADLRRRQISALFERAETERLKGRKVVMGGDFNLRLVETNFRHDTAEKDLFWLHDFPTSILPVGWHLAVDSGVATVRTNERPFQTGRNYTTVIDGFLLSPEVELVSVSGTDMGFRHSDHQPVRAVLRSVGIGTACKVEPDRP